jgi:hypothetical protein
MDCAASYGELAVLTNFAIDPVPLRHDVLADRQADAAPPVGRSSPVLIS